MRQSAMLGKELWRNVSSSLVVLDPGRAAEVLVDGKIPQIGKEIFGRSSTGCNSPCLPLPSRRIAKSIVRPRVSPLSSVLLLDRHKQQCQQIDPESAHEVPVDSERSHRSFPLAAIGEVSGHQNDECKRKNAAKQMDSVRRGN